MLFNSSTVVTRGEHVPSLHEAAFDGRRWNLAFRNRLPQTVCPPQSVPPHRATCSSRRRIDSCRRLDAHKSTLTWAEKSNTTLLVTWIWNMWRNIAAWKVTTITTHVHGTRGRDGVYSWRLLKVDQLRIMIFTCNEFNRFVDHPQLEQKTLRHVVMDTQLQYSDTE